MDISERSGLQHPIKGPKSHSTGRRGATPFSGTGRRVAILLTRLFLKRDLKKLKEEHIVTQGRGSVLATCTCVRAKLDLWALFTVMKRQTTPSPLNSS